MMPGNYLRLFRKIIKSPIWATPNDGYLAVTLLVMANWKDGRFQTRSGKIIPVKRGEIVTTLRRIWENCQKGLSVQEIRTSLLHLEKSEFLTRTSTSHYRHIKITKYNDYQGDGIGGNSQANKDLTRSQQGLNKESGGTIRNNNKGKKLRIRKNYKETAPDFCSTATTTATTTPKTEAEREAWKWSGQRERDTLEYHKRLYGTVNGELPK